MNTKQRKQEAKEKCAMVKEALSGHIEGDCSVVSYDNVIEVMYNTVNETPTINCCKKALHNDDTTIGICLDNFIAFIPYEHKKEMVDRRQEFSKSQDSYLWWNDIPDKKQATNDPMDYDFMHTLRAYAFEVELAKWFLLATKDCVCRDHDHVHTSGLCYAFNFGACFSCPIKYDLCKNAGCYESLSKYDACTSYDDKTMVAREYYEFLLSLAREFCPHVNWTNWLEEENE